MITTAVILLSAMTICALAQEVEGLSYNYDAYRLSRQMMSSGQTPEEPAPAGSITDEFEKKSPGKALLLSAIIPGAGEYYAGSKLKAALFFSLEIAAWTGVAIYQKDGRDKEGLYKEYANEHWSKFKYWYWLENCLKNWAAFIKYRYGGNPPEKTQTGWVDGQLYDFFDYRVYEKFEEYNGFTHNLPGANDQQYYEMIGKYLTQFGPGWDDCFTPDSIASVGPDAKRTYYWDGVTTGNAYYYGDMRYDSNQAFEAASYCFQAVMLNHVISALDAGFTVRMKNRKIETAFKVYPKNYLGENVTMGQLIVNW